jgi:hypothetical protein
VGSADNGRMSMDAGPPPPFEFPADPPIVEVEPAAPPPKARPGWFGWAIGVGVVVIAVAAFFVTKSIAGSGSASPAAAASGNGTNANGSSGGSGNFQGGNGTFQGRFPGASGEITAIDGTTLTVKDRQNQSVKVTTSAGTRITIEKTVAVGDIAKGDRISVTGTRSGTTFAASRISITDLQFRAPGTGSQGGTTPGGGSGTNGQPGGFGPPGGFSGQGGPPVTDANGNPTGRANRRALGGFTFGTVTKVDGGTITISSFDGSTTTVTTTSSTTVTKSVQGSFSDLKVGQNIRAVGTTGSDGSVAATSINEGSGGFGFFGGTRRGQGNP